MAFQAIANERLFQRWPNKLPASFEATNSALARACRTSAIRRSVSRLTIGEAMIALEMAGLVELRTGAGACIGSAGPRAEAPDAGPSAFELLAARRLLEGEIAAVAAENATPEFWGDMRAPVFDGRAYHTRNREDVASATRRSGVGHACHLAHVETCFLGESGALATASRRKVKFQNRPKTG